jgi:hypothetical protein
MAEIGVNYNYVPYSDNASEKWSARSSTRGMHLEQSNEEQSNTLISSEGLSEWRSGDCRWGRCSKLTSAPCHLWGPGSIPGKVSSYITLQIVQFRANNVLVDAQLSIQYFKEVLKFST